MPPKEKKLFIHPYVFKNNKESILYGKAGIEEISYRNLYGVLLIFLFPPLAVVICFVVIIVLLIKIADIQLKYNFSTIEACEYYFLKFLAFKNTYNQALYAYTLKEFIYKTHRDAKEKTPLKNHNIAKKENATVGTNHENHKSKTTSIWDDYTSALDEFKK